jgi:hypothetical protein
MVLKLARYPNKEDPTAAVYIKRIAPPVACDGPEALAEY